MGRNIGVHGICRLHWGIASGGVLKRRSPHRSCNQSDNDAVHHFAGAGKMIAVGKGGNREVPDFHLSRFACYLIALQNGGSALPTLKLPSRAKYFAIQTRRQELTDACSGIRNGWNCASRSRRNSKRCQGQRKTRVYRMSCSACSTMRATKDYTVGSAVNRSRLARASQKEENLLDGVDTTELAANQFRMTQTREKLAQQGIKGQQKAIDTHLQVGKKSPWQGRSKNASAAPCRKTFRPRSISRRWKNG